MDLLIPCFSSSTTMDNESKPRFISPSIDYRREAEVAGRATSPRSVTIVLVTHEPDVAQYAKRQVRFRDGRIVHDEPNASQRSAMDEWETIASNDPGSSTAQIELVQR